MHLTQYHRILHNSIIIDNALLDFIRLFDDKYELYAKCDVNTSKSYTLVRRKN